MEGTNTHFNQIFYSLKRKDNNRFVVLIYLSKFLTHGRQTFFLNPSISGQNKNIYKEIKIKLHGRTDLHSTSAQASVIQHAHTMHSPLNLVKYAYLPKVVPPLPRHLKCQKKETRKHIHFA